MLRNVAFRQCNLIGLFLKDSVTNIVTKEAQIIGNFLGYFKECHVTTY